MRAEYGSRCLAYFKFSMKETATSVQEGIDQARHCKNAALREKHFVSPVRLRLLTMMAHDEVRN